MTELHDIEDELRFMETDKEHRTLKAVLDAILTKDKENKREYAEG